MVEKRTTSWTNLRGALAQLYPGEADARRVAHDAGVPPEHVNWGGSAVNRWQAVLAEASKHGLVDAVVAIAAREYPNDDTLRGGGALETRPISSVIASERTSIRDNSISQFFHVSHDGILVIHEAATTAGLGASRAGLLAGLPASFVAGLQTSVIPRDQLLLDLHALNAVQTLASGVVPLASWLKNAIALVGTRDEATTFKLMLVSIRASNSKSSYLASPSTSGARGEKRQQQPHKTDKATPALRSTILSNSRSKRFDEAVQEWRLALLGYSENTLNCEACGQKISYYARASNNHIQTGLTLGVDCYRSLERVSGTSDRGLSEYEYKASRQRKTLSKILGKLVKESGWQCSEFDYGSWRSWFLSLANRGMLPKEMLVGVAELQNTGVLSSDDQIDKFAAYHNARRRCPGHILLPHIRLRGLYHEPYKVPISLTVDEAVTFSLWGKSKADLGSYIVNRLCDRYSCQKRSLTYQLAVVYNYVLALARGYEGCRGDDERAAYIEQDDLLRRNPLLFDFTDRPFTDKSRLDVEIHTTIRMLAELVAPIFAAVSDRSSYIATLATRLSELAATGSLPVIWPLASATSPVGAPLVEEDGSHVADEVIGNVFRKHDLSAKYDSSLTLLARSEWTSTFNQNSLDVAVFAGWLTASESKSCAIVVMTRRGTSVAIGLNRCWESASLSDRQAALNVIIRDLGEKHQQQESLLQMRARLKNIGASRSHSTSEPMPTVNLELAKHRIVSVLGIDLSSSVFAQFPRLVPDRTRAQVHYDRWSHTLFVPVVGRKITLPKSISSEVVGAWLSLQPLTIPTPKKQPAWPAPLWYNTNWDWINPTENKVDAEFLQYVGIGLPRPTSTPDTDARDRVVELLERLEALQGDRAEQPSADNVAQQADGADRIHPTR